VRLPEARSTRAFQIYTNWAYTSEIRADTTANETQKFHDLVELYLLGDLLDDIKLRNRTLRLLNTHIQVGEIFISAVMCQIIWENTPPHSLLRNWAVDVVISTRSVSYYERNRASWPADLTFQIAVKLLRRQGDVCDYAGLGKRVEEYMEADNDA